MIEILETPPHNSVQDLGRQGLRRYGVVRAGALDRVAMQAANLLAGNRGDEAGIEIQLYPVRIRFHTDTVIAVGGAEGNAWLDGWEIPPWWTVPVKAGQDLHLQVPRRGVRSYLACAGGLDVPVVLGGRGTQARHNFGGLHGRNLAPGDRIGLLAPPDARHLAWPGLGIVPPREALPPAPHDHAEPADVVLRVLPAAEHDQFDAASRTAFWHDAWTVTAQSDRMGFRLAGPELRRPQPREMRSHGIVPGVVQVPPSGQPIIQLADGNSAGGYPKIGVVVDADLWRLAQTPPGRRVRFAACAVADARAAEQQAAHYLDRLRAALQAADPVETLRRHIVSALQPDGAREQP